MLEIPAAAVVKLYTRMPPTQELILGIRLYVYMQHRLNVLEMAYVSSGDQVLSTSDSRLHIKLIKLLIVAP